MLNKAVKNMLVLSSVFTLTAPISYSMESAPAAGDGAIVPFKAEPDQRKGRFAKMGEKLKKSRQEREEIIKRTDEQRKEFFEELVEYNETTQKLNSLIPQADEKGMEAIVKAEKVTREANIMMGLIKQSAMRAEKNAVEVILTAEEAKKFAEMLDGFVNDVENLSEDFGTLQHALANATGDIKVELEKLNSISAALAKVVADQM